MNARWKTDTMEATRLTRAGRLIDAMAILRGLIPSTRPAGFADDATQALSGGPRKGGRQQQVSATLHRFLDRLGDLGSTRALDGLVGDVVGRAPVPVPDGAQFEERNYANQAGRRSYKLYVPSGYNARALPLVVMLHGCTQSPDDFAAGTRMNQLAEELTFLVAYPAQDMSANGSKCWNWFDASNQQRDQGEPSLIAGITRQITRDFLVEPGRVYIAGLSAGGAAAAIMGSTYPDLYAAIGVHSGLACGAATDVPSAFEAMRQGRSSGVWEPSARDGSGRATPTIVFHGDRDMIVNPVNGDQVIAQAKAAADLRITVTRGQAPGGMSYTRTVQVDDSGRRILEQWVLHGAGHAWSGGSSAGSHTEPRGPDASREMMRFFLQHPAPAA
ncbi:MAG: PHB depolymerase family esterase [Xanthobacteraceae bacterium]